MKDHHLGIVAHLLSCTYYYLLGKHALEEMAKKAEQHLGVCGSCDTFILIFSSVRLTRVCWCVYISVNTKLGQWVHFVFDPGQREGEGGGTHWWHFVFTIIKDWLWKFDCVQHYDSEQCMQLFKVCRGWPEITKFISAGLIGVLLLG